MSLPVFDLNGEIHKAILRNFIQRGKPPDITVLQEEFQISKSEIIEILKTLEKKGVIYIDSGRRLISAYPFSASPTEFTVHLRSGRSVYAMCAIDALGISLMLREDAVIETKCHHCNKPIKIEVTRDSRIGKIEPIDAKPVVSYKKAEGCTNPALEQCPSINFFFSVDHFSREPNQELFTLEEALEEGRKSFANLLFPKQ